VELERAVRPVTLCSSRAEMAVPVAAENLQVFVVLVLERRDQVWLAVRDNVANRYRGGFDLQINRFAGRWQKLSPTVPEEHFCSVLVTADDEIQVVVAVRIDKHQLLRSCADRNGLS